MDGWTEGKQCQSKEDQLEATVVAEARDHYSLDYMNIPVGAERRRGNWERFERYNRKECGCEEQSNKNNCFLPWE